MEGGWLSGRRVAQWGVGWHNGEEGGSMGKRVS